MGFPQGNQGMMSGPGMLQQQQQAMPGGMGGPPHGMQHYQRHGGGPPGGGGMFLPGVASLVEDLDSMCHFPNPHRLHAMLQLLIAPPVHPYAQSECL
jgi:hypothetical protein